MRSRPTEVLLLALAGLAASCAKGRVTFRNAPVVLVSIDTLRADHLPAYGYTKVETPAIDALRHDSVLFENAYSHVPLTLPSHVTIFTGLLPPQNGVRDNVGYTLDPSLETLADLLKKKGYATGAAVSAMVLGHATGLSRGFDEYDDRLDLTADAPTAAQVQRSGFESEKVAESWIRRNDAKPFFYFLHVYEPHSPYVPIEPFKTIYKDRPYDGEIATADRIVGEFLDFLKSRHVYDRAIVILLSDHGEGLGQHGEGEHGTLLYRDTLHVPLLVKLPGGRNAGKSVAPPVGLTDVFPTVASLVEIPVPGALRLAGRRLPVTAPSETFPVRMIYSETLFPRYHFGWSELAALTDQRYEYIHGPRPELYDILADPSEIHDLAPAIPAAFRKMRAALLAMDRPRQAPGAASAEQLRKLAALGYLGSASPPETEENLPNPVDHIGELSKLADAFHLAYDGKCPEAVGVLEKLLRVNSAMADAWGMLGDCQEQMGESAAALRSYGEAVARQPGNGGYLLDMARLQLAKGDLEAAQAALKAAEAAQAPEAALIAAEIDVRKGDLKTARDEIARVKSATREAERAARKIALRLAREGHPDEASAFLEPFSGSRDVSTIIGLGQTLTDAGRIAEARAVLERGAAANPQNAAIRESLGITLLKAGDLPGAKTALETAVRLDDSRAQAWNALGVVRMRADDADGALAAWRKAVERDPSQYDSLYNIALVAGRLGRSAEYRRALEQFIARAPRSRYGKEIDQARRLLAAGKVRGK